MSHHALQRVVVRMLYDPQFVQEVYADSARALQGVDVTPAERAWLLRPDLRAYGTDPLRPSRSLTGLLEEYPVSGALTLRAARGSEPLDRFFLSEAFHRCIQEGGSLALSFGDYLRNEVDLSRIPDPRVGPMADLERAIARVRRSGGGTRSPAEQLAGISPLLLGPRPVSTPTEGWFRLSAAIEILALPMGTLALHQAIVLELSREGRGLLESVLDQERALPITPALESEEQEHLLVERASGGESEATIGTVSAELGELLETCRLPGPYPTLLETARRLGADPGDDAEIVNGLIDDGLLVEVTKAPPT